MPVFKFELTINETNMIIQALSKFPFEQVGDLVPKIIKGAEEQLKAFNEAEAAKKESKHVDQE